MTSEFRALPSVDRVLQDPALADPVWPRQLARAAVREALGVARERVAAGEAAPDLPVVVADALDRLRRQLVPSLRPVVNATGVILHTNLGRAPVSDAAAAAMAVVAARYSNLELDLESGERGSRATHLRALLREVTGAEDGLAVNNNAGALLLALSALAAGREVVVSRGQAVEIGGGFRIPDVMRQSGAILVEVGTTNRTYRSDYASAITPRTALLLRVHPSNFRLEGFVHSVGLDELVALGREVGVGVLDDVGSGALIDPRPFGLGAEPLVPDSVRLGATVVCFSGDKLLGGPQAGVIVGKAAAIELIRRHPLARALRIDKVSLAGLEATLRHYQRGEATSEVPVWRMISTPADTLERRARALAASFPPAIAQVVATRAAVGGGSLPQETLPSWGLRVVPSTEGSGAAAASLARRLRSSSPPVVARIEQDSVVLDLRTVRSEDDAVLATALAAALDREGSSAL